MGSRGASSGVAIVNKKERKYGTEYTTLHQLGNIKFVRYNDSTSPKAPLETMTKGRIYVTIDTNNKVRYISFYDKNGLKNKQIDVNGKIHKIKGVSTRTHTHYGYDEKHTDANTDFVSKSDLKLIAKILKEWYNYTNQ